MKTARTPFCEKAGIIPIIRKVTDAKRILCELKSYENELKY